MPFVCVQPLMSSQARRAEDLTSGKTEARDAVLIARLAGQLRCYLAEPADETWARLRHLGARRARLIAEQTAQVQQMRDLRGCVWPAVLDAARQPFKFTTWHAALTGCRWPLCAAPWPTGVVAGFGAVFRKLITWASQARGAVARPWVCPACGTTRTWTAGGEAAWNQRGRDGLIGAGPAGDDQQRAGCGGPDGIGNAHRTMAPLSSPAAVYMTHSMPRCRAPPMPCGSQPWFLSCGRPWCPGRT